MLRGIDVQSVQYVTLVLRSHPFTRYFCPLKIYGKMYPSHHNDILNGLYFLAQAVFSVHIKLNNNLYEQLDSRFILY